MDIYHHISKFIGAQTVATVCCTSRDGRPHCFNCYYAFNEKSTLLLFKTSPETMHMKMLAEIPSLAGTILPDKLNKLSVKGIQFEGELLAQNAEAAEGAAGKYHMKFPYALAMSGTVFAIQINYMKMTDNSLGFGTKIEWRREAVQ